MAEDTPACQKCEELKNKAARLEGDVAAKQRMIDAGLKDMERLGGELKTARKRCDDYRQKMATWAAERDRYKKLAEDNRSDDHLLQSVHKLTHELKKVREHQSAKDIEIAKLKAAMATMSIENHRIESGRKDAERRVQAMQDTFDMLTRGRNAADERERRATEALHRADARVVELNKKFSASLEELRAKLEAEYKANTLLRQKVGELMAARPVAEVGQS